MAHTSKIEWTEATWNPWHGCHKVSAGCKNCYMFRDKKHYGQDPNVVVRSKTKFYDPLKWKEPRTIFTCSWSDFFIEEADPWRDEAFAIMALTPQHTYLVLTKRPDRMREYLMDAYTRERIVNEIYSLTPREKVVGVFFDLYNRGVVHKVDPHTDREIECLKLWPLPNVWLGVSVEDQKTADERIPLLLQTPAALRWLSVEPLLGPVDLSHYIAFDETNGDSEFLEANGWAYDSWSGGFMGPNTHRDPCYAPEPGLHWVIVGGESGPDARPMHPDWVRSIRDQCQAAEVPFFFKQWGEWTGDDDLVCTPGGDLGGDMRRGKAMIMHAPGNEEGYFRKGDAWVKKVGKKAAGRLLDGREWNEMPNAGRENMNA